MQVFIYYNFLFQFSGNLTAATDVEILESKKINHILTLDSCPLPRKITELNSMKTMFIQGI